MSLEDINVNYSSSTEEEDNEMNEIDNFDFENIGMVPCEMCETMINFDEYNDHITECIRNYTLRRQRMNTLNGLMNILNASEFLYRSNNINTNRVPRDDEMINDNDENDEYNDENETSDENPGNVNTADVNNIDVNSEENDVVNADNADNENNDEVVEPYDETINSFTPLPIRRRLEASRTIPVIFPNHDNIAWSNNLGRRLMRNIEINIGNLHNLTQNNNATDYDFNMLLQEFMGGNVEIGVKDFNKYITVLSSNDINDNDSCCICFDNLKDILNNSNLQENDNTKVNLPVKTTCGHIYCRECIYKWLSKNKNCPICQNVFEENTNNNTNTNDNDNNNNTNDNNTNDNNTNNNNTSDNDTNEDLTSSTDSLPSLIPFDNYDNDILNEFLPLFLNRR